MHCTSNPAPFATLTAVLFALACGDGTGPGSGATVQAELIRLAGSTNPSPARSLDAAAARADGHTWSSDIDMTSFESPIRAIWLQGDSAESALVYECVADSNNGCLVDLAGPALQDLLGADPVTVRAGTYDEVVVSTCEDEGEYTASLTGSVSLGGRTYVTKSTGVLDTAGTAEAVQIVFSGCARTYPVPDPLVVADTAGEAIAFKLYFDIRDIAWASLGTSQTANGWIPGGCTGPRPGDVPDETPYLCAAYPDVAGVVDSVTPAIERYRLNGGATLGLIFQASNGEFIGGFTRRFFEEGSTASPGFTADTPVEEWTDNGDDTYRLTTYGTSGPDGGPVGHYLTIAAFRRVTHDGTAQDFDGNAFAYAAVRIE